MDRFAWTQHGDVYLKIVEFGRGQRRESRVIERGGIGVLGHVHYEGAVRLEPPDAAAQLTCPAQGTTRK